MMTRKLTVAGKLSLGLLFIASGPVFADPADGNGNKLVGEFGFFDEPLPCGAGADLVFDATGWFQLQEFAGDGNRNAVLTVFHLDVVYRNPATGETWIWRDRGPDREYFVTNEDGITELHLAVTGRVGVWNIIGHAVFNIDTGEFIFDGGQSPFGGEVGMVNANDYACSVLNVGF